MHKFYELHKPLQAQRLPVACALQTVPNLQFLSWLQIGCLKIAVSSDLKAVAVGEFWHVEPNDCGIHYGPPQQESTTHTAEGEQPLQSGKAAHKKSSEQKPLPFDLLKQ